MNNRFLVSLLNELWALEGDYLQIVKELIVMRLSGTRLSDAEIKARIGDSSPRPDVPQGGAVAVLPLFGVMGRRMDMFAQISGGTSTERYAQEFTSAVNEPSVKSILMLVDSPGGTVAGTQELADTVYAARGKKPIVAQVVGQAASAALWVASQADEIIASPSSELGSIGVCMIHQEESKKLAQDGITTSIIRVPAMKMSANSMEPLSAEARADIEAKALMVYEQFKGAVARGRGVPVSRVERDFGGGLTMFTEEAKRVGLIDRIGTVEETLSAMLGKRSGGGMRAEADHKITIGDLVTQVEQDTAALEAISKQITEAEEQDRAARLRLL